MIFEFGTLKIREGGPNVPSGPRYHGPPLFRGGQPAISNRLDPPPPLGKAPIYYYTPLLLNLATNEQQQQQHQQQQQQPFFFAVLAIIPSQRYRLYCTQAIVDLRWCLCQIQVLSQKSAVAPRGGGAQLGGDLTKHILCPKIAFSGPKHPTTHSKRPNDVKRLLSLHVYLDLPVTKSPLLPSSSTICPRNGPKLAKSGP